MKSFLMIALGMAAACELEATDIIATDQAAARILVLDEAKPWASPGALRWSWSPEADPRVPKKHARAFSNPDECKVTADGKTVLITASGGGFGAIDVASRSVRFYGVAPGNPHSIELLPDGVVAVASTDGAQSIFLFVVDGDAALAPERQTVRRFPLYAVHGLYWDDTHQRLWALGMDELAAYTYNFDKSDPKLTSAERYPLGARGDSGGHDLCPVPGTLRLFLTAHQKILTFDTGSRAFVQEIDLRNVKSISMDKPGGRILISFPQTGWWTDTLQFLNADGTLRPAGTLPGARIYKARWVPSSFLAP